MAEDTLAMLTKKQRQLEDGIKAANKLGDTAKAKGFSMETLMALQLTMNAVGFKVPPLLSNIIGYSTLGNGMARLVGRDSMKDLLDEFRHPDNVANMREKMGLNDAEKVSRNPLMGFISNLLDSVALPEGQTTSKAELEKLEQQKAENQAKIDALAEQKEQEAEARRLQIHAVKLEAAQYEREMARLKVEKMKQELGEGAPTPVGGGDGSLSQEIINEIVTARVAELMKDKGLAASTVAPAGGTETITAAVVNNGLDVTAQRNK